LTSEIGRREHGKAARRHLIKTAAIELFSEKGFREATTRDIAARAGVASGTIFKYADEKIDLLLMSINDDLEPLTEHAFATVPSEVPLIDQLIHVLAPRYAYWGSFPELARQVIAQDDVATPEPKSRERNRYGYHRARLLAGITGLYIRAQLAGAADRDKDARDVTTLLNAIYLAHLRAWLVRPNPNYEDGIMGLRTLLDLAIDGIGPPPPATASQ